MFQTAQQCEATEAEAAKNWALFHKRKRLITVPLKWGGAALLLSFAYTTGELAGVESCPAIITRK